MVAKACTVVCSLSYNYSLRPSLITQPLATVANGSDGNYKIYDVELGLAECSIEV